MLRDKGLHWPHILAEPLAAEEAELMVLQRRNFGAATLKSSRAVRLWVYERLFKLYLVFFFWFHRRTWLC